MADDRSSITARQVVRLVQSTLDGLPSNSGIGDDIDYERIVREVIEREAPALPAGEKKVIQELFFGYDPDSKDTSEQYKRRQKAMQYYRRAVAGRYDEYDVEATRSTEDYDALVEKTDDLLDRDDAALLNFVEHYLTRARRDGESLWISLVDYPRYFARLKSDDKRFILAVLGRETSSGDNLWDSLMRKTATLLLDASWA